MQIQRGLKKDSTLTKFVLGAHPIIEHFIYVAQLNGPAYSVKWIHYLERKK